MILADKIISLRKKNGWSQEELAEKMNVSRQAVSKWEGAQSVPDLERVLQLSKLFGVSTDYLLKDELEAAEYIETDSLEKSVRRVSLEEAQAFLSVKEKAAKWVAGATFLCILGVIPLPILGAFSEVYPSKISENLAGGLGLAILLALVAVATGCFVYLGSKTAPFEYLKRGQFETEYGVSGMVNDRKKKYQKTYTRNTILGSCLSVLSVVPLFIGACFVNEETGEGIIHMVCAFGIMLLLVGIGAMLFVVSGNKWEAFQILLKEGEYTEGRKQRSSFTRAISRIYWLVVTAGYLAFSFTTNQWGISWIVWPVAGVLHEAVLVVCKMIEEKKK